MTKERMDNEIPIFNSDNDVDNEIITIVEKVMSDCVVLDFISGGNINFPKSKFGKNGINKGNIVTLKYFPDKIADEYFRICDISTKEQWQKNKIEQANKEKKVISGMVLYPYKNQGIFVNIYGKRALMLNDQVSDNKRPQEGEVINVAISSVKEEGSQYRIIVSQKWAEKIESLKSVYESIQEGQYLNTIIDKIEENFIIVKYENLRGIIYLSDLFWCNIKNIDDHLEIGKPIRAKVVSKEINESGNFKVRLSHKEFALNPWEDNIFSYKHDEIYGLITDVGEKSITIKITEGVEGILHANNMTRMEFKDLKTRNPNNVYVYVKAIDKIKKRIELCTPTFKDLDEIWNNIQQNYEINKTYTGLVIEDENEDDRLWVQLKEGIEVAIKKDEIRWPNCSSTKFKSGNHINVLITDIDETRRKIFASIKQLIPNPWEAAKASIRMGETCIVKVIDRKEKMLIIETLDNFHLNGKIETSEISWFPLKQEEEPQIGQELEAKVISFNPEKRVLKLSVRQLKEDPWYSLYLGAEVNGTILSQTESTFINVQLENEFLAKTSELTLLPNIGKTFPFKIVSLNRATKEIIVNHDSWEFDKQTEEIVKSFFNVQ